MTKAQIIILAAGQGKRLLPLTKMLPKTMLKVGGTPIIDHILNSINLNSVNEFLIVVGHNKEEVKKYVRGLNLKLDCNFIDNDVYQTTGNTLSMVMGLRYCQGDVLILDGDILYYHYKSSTYNSIRKWEHN